MASTIGHIIYSEKDRSIEIEVTCTNCDLFAGYVYLDEKAIIEMVLEERTISQQVKETYCSDACYLGRPLGA